jgi:hypothetical protein
MMATNIEIKNRVAGDDLDLVVTITDLPEETEINKAWFTAKEHEDDADVDAIVQKIVTSGFAHSGTASVTVSFTILLTAAETELFRPGRPYFYDIQIKDALNKLDTPIHGTITLDRGKTQATS